MTRDDYTHIAYLLDRSGSMGAVQDAVASAFNEFVESQRREPGRTTMGLTLFNTTVDVRHAVVDLDDVERLVVGVNYVPGGMTALDDATAITINETGRVLSDIDEGDRPSRVLFVIHTDGHENSSREYSRRQVIDMRRHQEDAYAWTFLFIGADQDAWDNPYGIDARNTISYDNTDVGTRDAGAALVAAASTYRSTPSGKSATLSSGPKDLRKNKAKRSKN